MIRMNKKLRPGRHWRDNVRFQLETTLSRGRGTAVNQCRPFYAGKEIEKKLSHRSAARLTEAVKTQRPFAYRFRKRRCGTCSYFAGTASAGKQISRDAVLQHLLRCRRDRFRRYGEYRAASREAWKPRAPFSSKEKNFVRPKRLLFRQKLSMKSDRRFSAER